MDPLKRILEQIEKASIEKDKRLANAIDSVIHQQNLSGQISIIQQQKEILAYVYQKNTAYTNLVMIGGYAGVFAIWQLTKGHLSAGQELMVALLLTISIFLFAGFEVFKMITHAIFFRRLNRIITSNIPETERPKAWQVAWNDFSQQESRIWLFFLIPTVLTGFGAGFFLLWIFVWNITSGI